MPISDVDPNAGEESLETLVLGIETNGADIRYGSEPAALALIFPYLFTCGVGYYSLTSRIQGANEQERGHALSNTRMTVAAYTKRLIQMADRRFGRTPKFLFFMLDFIEKQNIHSSKRWVVPINQNINYTRAMLYDDDTRTMRGEHATLVPHIIRSSRAHKRKHSLNLKNMFEKLGPPTLFITMTCNDFATEYQRLLNGSTPWSDPVFFAQHYKRSWQKLFNRYILKRRCHFWNLVGGVTDWSYTVELQERGSSHVHSVLWTGKTPQQLLDPPNLVSCQIPNPRTNRDLYHLVRMLQIYECRNYCQNLAGQCRFGFPKRPSNEQRYDPASGRAVYRRSIEEDGHMNPYNP